MNSDPSLGEAVDWLLRLESSQSGDPDWQAFQQWLNAKPSHGVAWQRVNNLFSAPMADLAAVDARAPGQRALASQMLNQPLPRRRLLGGSVAALLLGVTGATFGNRVTPLTQMLADLHTPTGERRNATLPDGSRVTLDARSAVDLMFMQDLRRLRLREGALHLTIADQGQRVLQLDNRDARLYSQDGRFLLRQMAESSLLSVLQGRVRIAPLKGDVRWAQSGEVLRFDQHTVRIEAPSLWSRGDWMEGRVDAHDEPLGELIGALRNYHAGWLRISPEAARQRVYGSFMLADLRRTLRALEESLPIRVQNAGGWLVNIDLRNS